MKQRWLVVSRCLAVLAAAFTLSGTPGSARAADPTVAVRKCVVYACDSAQSLANEGRVAAQGLPLGTIIFVSSERYPLSAFVRVCTSSRGVKTACLITAGDLGAVELDNRVYARAAKIAPIDVPADVGSTATNAIEEIAEHWAFTQGILIATGKTGINPWHNLFDPLTWVWMEIHDKRTNETYRVYVKDRITLRFIDGSTVEAEMKGPNAPSGHFFKFMFDTIRLPNGEPYVAAAPIPATPLGGGMSQSSPWPSGAFSDELVFAFCVFLHSHCEFKDSGTLYDCYYRREYFPCG